VTLAILRQTERTSDLVDLSAHHNPLHVLPLRILLISLCETPYRSATMR
jgi:hypothetical protein